MKKRTLLLLASLVVAAGIVVAFLQTKSDAQSPIPATSQSSSQTTQPPPMSSDGLNVVDAQGHRRYLVGPGDILDVRVYGQSELNSTVEIDDEGNISSLPFL